MSALRTTAQNPGLSSDGIIEPSAGGCQLTGRSARRMRSDSSRWRGVPDQKLSGERETGS